MLRRGVVLLAACALGACAFSSTEPLFADADAVHPISDGARFNWTEVSGGPMAVTLTFTRDGAGYDIQPSMPNQPALEDVLFTPIVETPEEDYVAQWLLQSGDEPLYAHVFVWEIDGGYRLIVDLRAFPEGAPARAAAASYCTDEHYGGCQFPSRERLLAFYREHVHPAFVVSGAPAPQRYAELRPVEDR